MFLKKANILMGNVVYIILALAFASILMFFVFQQSSNAGLMEERTAKQIALAIDASSHGMQMDFNLDKVLNKLDEEYVENNFDGLIEINGNSVIVKFSSNSVRAYNFFNDVFVEKTMIKGEPNILKLEIKEK